MIYYDDIILYFVLGCLGLLTCLVGYCFGWAAKSCIGPNEAFLRKLELYAKAAGTCINMFTVVWYPNLYLAWCIIQIAENGT